MGIEHYIEHTLLKPDASTKEIEALCDQAINYRFVAVCVNACHVPLCARLLSQTPVIVATTVGFPLGASLSSAKAFEAAQAVQMGAQEIDMVINVGAIKDLKPALVLDDIGTVVKTVSGKASVKVILETSLLTDDEKIIACTLAKQAGADFVKTSTGFVGKGANVHDVRLLCQASKPEMRVKASGGIRDLVTAQAMIEAGADRIGTSAGIQIVEEELNALRSQLR